jgi:hypothetical protein
MPGCHAQPKSEAVPLPDDHVSDASDASDTSVFQESFSLNMATAS